MFDHMINDSLESISEQDQGLEEPDLQSFSEQQLLDPSVSFKYV